MMGSLRSTAITAASSLLRIPPPLCPASVLKPSWDRHLGCSLRIGATGSHVPRTSLGCGHATSTPDAAWPILRHPPGLSRGVVKTPVSTSVIEFSTLHQWFTLVRLRSPHLTLSCRAFSSSAHHKGSLPLQPGAVWYLLLKGGTEGPALISCAACRHPLRGLLRGTPTTTLTNTVLEALYAQMEYVLSYWPSALFHVSIRIL